MTHCDFFSEVAELPKSKTVIGDFRYTTVGEKGSFGGSQNWFAQNGVREDRIIRDCGCGLIATADILLYRARFCDENTPDTARLLSDGMSITEYLDFIRLIRRRYARPLPIGLTGFELARGFNRYFRRYGLPYRAKWGFQHRDDDIVSIIKEQLSRDWPCIISIAPDLLHNYREDRLWFYLDDDAKEKKYMYKALSGHYVTVTEVLEDVRSVKLVMSSWGKRYVLDLPELMAYNSVPFGTVTGSLLRINSEK